MKNFKWDKKYLYWGVTAFCVVVASIAFFWFLQSMGDVRRILAIVGRALSPVFYGFLIAYLLSNILDFFESRVFSRLCSKIFKKPVKARKAARIMSIVVTLILTFGFIAALLAFMLPEIYWSVAKIVSRSTDYLNLAVKWLEKTFDGLALEPIIVDLTNSISDRLVDWLSDNVLPQLSGILDKVGGGLMSVVGGVAGSLVTVVGGIVNFLIGIVISVYVMYNKEIFASQARKLTYSVFKVKTANAIMAEIDFVNDAFGNYIVGTLIDAMIVGIVNYIFMSVMGMSYTALISIIVAVTNIIPVFGPVIGAVPSALLLVLEKPMHALIFVIFTVVLQQIDGQILKPRIHASRTGLSGFWIMFAILFFGGIFGIVGMLIGVPVTTVLYNIFRRVSNDRLRRRGLPSDTRFYLGLASIDPATGEPTYRPTPEPEKKRPPKPKAPEDNPPPETPPETDKK